MGLRIILSNTTGVSNRDFKEFGEFLVFGRLQPVCFPVDTPLCLNHVKGVSVSRFVRRILGTPVHHLKIQRNAYNRTHFPNALVSFNILVTYLSMNEYQGSFLARCGHPLVFWENGIFVPFENQHRFCKYQKRYCYC